MRRTSGGGADMRVEWVVIDEGILIWPVTYPDGPTAAIKSDTAREEISIERARWWQRWLKGKTGTASRSK